MTLQRFLMKLLCPRRLAERDIRRVFQQIELADRHVQRGTLIGYYGDISERDLAHLLLLMEKNGYIERDPGPFDAPHTADPLRSWWCPGAHWLEGVDQLKAIR